MRAGSSPHTRGARGLTAPSARRVRDHPRIRGEHPLRNELVRDVEGIIPAYAGSTKNYFSLKPISAGSSPHTRGALRCLGPVQRSQRIIPAYAGSTQPCISSDATWRGSSPHTRGAPLQPMRRRWRCGDHPRIRGEHFLRNALAPAPQGIIPAYAGSTGAPDWHVSDKAGSSPHTRGAL